MCLVKSCRRRRCCCCCCCSLRHSQLSVHSMTDFWAHDCDLVPPSHDILYWWTLSSSSLMPYSPPRLGICNNSATGLPSTNAIGCAGCCCCWCMSVDAMTPRKPDDAAAAAAAAEDVVVVPAPIPPYLDGSCACSALLFPLAVSRFIL